MNVSKAQAAQAAPGVNPFDQDFGRGYASLSNSLLKNEGQMSDADYFSRKGLAADVDKPVPPENVGNWLIATPKEAPAGYGIILSGTRERLKSYLDANRDSNPDRAARAQVLFDCWVEHTEWNIEKGINGPCHGDLMEMLGGSDGGVAAQSMSILSSTGPR